MVLAVARKDAHDAWGLPGGKVEAGETELVAARRALCEETGIWVPYHFFKEVFRHEDRVTFQVQMNRINWDDVDKLPPGEKLVRWVTPYQLVQGPFGDYNLRLLMKIGRL
jgi:ADP-ribose pyrophosphatase YjhB (NUDIX family)